MSMARFIAVTFAAFVLSLLGYAASAAPVAQPGAASHDQAVVNSKSTFTLIRGGYGGGGRGMRMGGMRMGPRMGSMRMGPRIGYYGMRGLGRRGLRRGRFERRFGRGFWWGGYGWYDDCYWPYQYPYCYYY